MNITILDHILPIPKIAKVVNPETKNLLHFLLSDPYFQQKCTELRKKYNIPKQGYNLEVLYNSKEVRKWWIEGLSLEKNIKFGDILFFDLREAEKLRMSKKNKSSYMPNLETLYLLVSWHV